MLRREGLVRCVQRFFMYAAVPFFLTALTGHALATTDLNKTVTVLGVQGGSTYAVAYFGVAEGFSVNCGLVYIDITNDFGKAAYSNVLAAKTSGEKQSRIDYAQTNGTCYVNLVEVAN